MVAPSWELAVVLLVLFAAASIAGHVSRLRQGWPIARAAVRALLQLAAVSVVLAVVVRSVLLSALFVGVMLSVAAATSAGRVTGSRDDWRNRLWRAAHLMVPIGLGALPVAALILFSGAVSLSGLTIVPIGGILVGGAMSATSLAGRRLLDELALRAGEVEAALALGFLRRDAVLEIVRPSAATALVPAIDQTRTVGLVTLPGAFVGVLLGGGTALEAGAAQVLVLVGLLLAETVAVWVVTEQVARGLWTRRSGARASRHGRSAT